MQSYWIESVKNENEYKELKEDIRTDVCIIGGGITGVSVAYKLVKENLNIILIEKDKMGYQTTGNSTAKITSQHGLFYKYLKDCYCNVKFDSKEWRNVDYSKYDLVITNPPFSQVREFLKHLVSIKIDFIIIVSDVLRYFIKNGKFDLGIPIYKGWDAQKFYRSDGTVKPVHCGWISNFQDNYHENKILNKKEQKDV